MSEIAARWSGVSSYGKEPSNSSCQCVSGENAWPGTALRAA